MPDFKRFATVIFLLPVMLMAFIGCHTTPIAPDVSIPSTMRVMTYNIRVGAGAEKALTGEPKDLNMDRILEFLRVAKADIILLQEVDKGTERSNGVDQAEFLAKSLGFSHVFAPAIELQGGHYGIAVLSRWPIVDSEVKPLYIPDYSKSNPEYPEWYSEPRVALVAHIDFQGKNVTVIDSHLGITADQRTEQIKEIAALIDGLNDGRMIIFGGDLNSTPEEEVLLPIRNRMRDSASREEPTMMSFPGIKPDRRIDFLFTSFLAEIKSSEVLPVELSDHRPLIAEYAIDMTPK